MICIYLLKKKVYIFHKIIKHRYQIAAKLSKGKNALEVDVGQEFGVRSIVKYSSKCTGIEYSSENIAYINEIQLNYKIYRVIPTACHLTILNFRLLMHYQ
jgi:hypothetical protein